MLIELPIFRNSQVVDWQNFCLEFPHCNRIETHLGTTFRVFTEERFVKFFVSKDAQKFTIEWINHKEANEDETDKARLLGLRWKRTGMGNPEAIETEMEDYQAAFDRFITLMFIESDDLSKILEK